MTKKVVNSIANMVYYKIHKEEGDLEGQFFLSFLDRQTF